MTHYTCTRCQSNKESEMNIELRWLVKAESTTDRPRLQFRQFMPRPDAIANALGLAMYWTEWKDVPIVVVKEGV